MHLMHNGKWGKSKIYLGLDKRKKTSPSRVLLAHLLAHLAQTWGCKHVDSWGLTPHRVTLLWCCRVSQCRGIVITSHLTECFGLLASYCLPRPARLVWLLLPDLLIILHIHPLPFHVHSCLCLKAAKGHFWGGGGEEADEGLVLPPVLALWGQQGCMLHLAHSDGKQRL